jgi:hypothetical protein
MRGRLPVDFMVLSVMVPSALFDVLTFDAADFKSSARI